MKLNIFKGKALKTAVSIILVLCTLTAFTALASGSLGVIGGADGPTSILVTDGEGMRVNAKSMLGMLYAMTFAEMWCECDKDIYMYIKEFCAE